LSAVPGEAEAARRGCERGRHGCVGRSVGTAEAWWYQGDMGEGMREWYRGGAAGEGHGKCEVQSRVFGPQGL